MIQTLFILTLCFLIIVISIYLGGWLLSAGTYSRDYDFYEAMQRAKNWRRSPHYISHKECLLLENKSKT